MSTALSLSERYPTHQITLLEASPTIPNPHGSSVDSSRIIRADYANPAYASLAAAAIQKWRNTEWGHDGRYTENGLALVYSEENSTAERYTRDSYQNVRRIEGDHRVQYLPSKAAVEEVVPRYAAGLNVAGGYINRGSGWGNAEAGVRFARAQLEKKSNVTVQSGEVAKLLVADDNLVIGVALTDDRTVTADLTILATGAWTPQLIDLRGRAQATGQVLAYIPLTPDEQAQLAHMPTILSFATGMFIIPPRNNELKIARHAYGYLNPKPVMLPDQDERVEISVPENDLPVPAEGQAACRVALREMLPAFAERPFSRTRICWYTDTCVFPALAYYMLKEFPAPKVISSSPTIRTTPTSSSPPAAAATDTNSCPCWGTKSWTPWRAPSTRSCGSCGLGRRNSSRRHSSRMMRVDRGGKGWY